MRYIIIGFVLSVLPDMHFRCSRWEYLPPGRQQCPVCKKVRKAMYVVSK